MKGDKGSEDGEVLGEGELCVTQTKTTMELGRAGHAWNSGIDGEAGESEIPDQSGLCTKEGRKEGGREAREEEREEERRAKGKKTQNTIGWENHKQLVHSQASKREAWEVPMGP